MMIACVKCQTGFDGSPSRRKCKKCVDDFRQSQLKDSFGRHIAIMRRYFQDAIYQFFRLQNDEHMGFAKLYFLKESQNA